MSPVRDTSSPPAGALAVEEYLATGEGRQARSLLRAHPAASFAGLPGAAVSFFLGAVLGEAHGSVLVLCATQEEAEEIREELEAFTGCTALFFPPWESLFLPTSLPDEDIFHDRLRVLRHLVTGGGDAGPTFIVAPVHAVLQPVPAAEELGGATVTVTRGRDLGRDELAAALAAAGFRHVPLVMRRGEFSIRGDIADVFPYDAAAPVRIECFGDTVDSIRTYDVETQRSIPGGALETCALSLVPVGSMFRQVADDLAGTLFDLLPAGDPVVLVEPDAIEDRLDRILKNLFGHERGDSLKAAFLDIVASRRQVRARSLALGRGEEAIGMRLGFGTAERFQGDDLAATLGRVRAELDAGARFTVFCAGDAERERIEQVLEDNGVPAGTGLEIRVGPVHRGFECRALRRVVLSTGGLFGRRTVRRSRRHLAETRVVESFFDLQEGDLVVHVAHGIGRYLGIERREKDGVLQEFLILEYRGGVKVHVPASRIELVQKYIGKGAHVPALDRVGGSQWSSRKDRVERAIQDFAAELLEIQAIRQEKTGTAYPPDDEWQRQFEAAFPFDDTPDQRRATESVKEDLTAPRPMDRLLCGDVGYGKTEVAMRAAFKVVNAGRQAVVLVPTTVLAQQHCRTFRERMAGFPIRIEQISRFSSAREQREILDATRRGEVDILIGTHRVLSEDVGFGDLGLVVIDEEQRFGVAHKERLKRMRATVDVLTLTATPIPRTLHMAMLGIRDISGLMTPPEGRSPIHTEVIEFDRATVREAIIRELNREGQVYFVHNRIRDIEMVRHQVQQVVPEARIAAAHGRMSEHQLEEIMLRFLDGAIDVLVSTTIIETGIDIPNVNTIFIDECDRFGLADLHQLRGRVGRSRHRAYCYLILPEHRHVNPDARKRILSIKEFSQLGAGFQIAMRDLEIRGAGNILGAEQSGHIAVVGYDLYCRLLEKSVKRLRGEEPDKAVEVEIDLAIAASIPEDLMPQENARLEMYRKISRAQDEAALEDLRREIEDRYGPPGDSVIRLLDLQRLRILGARRGLRSVRRDEESIILGCSESMRPLRDACPLRVVVLDPGSVAVVVNPPGRRRRTELTDELVFDAVLEWLETGELPAPLGRRSARVTAAPPRRARGGAREDAGRR